MTAPPTAFSRQEGVARIAVKLPISIVMIAIATVPTSLFYFSLATSAALGSTLVAFTIIIIGLSAPNALREPIIRSIVLIGIVTLGIVIHLIIASLLQPVDVGHALASLVPLTVIVVGGTVLANALATTSDRRFDQAVRAVLTTMGLFVVVKLLGLRVPAPREFSNPVFPYTEPSHLVLLFMPFYMYACVTTTSTRRLVLLALGLILILSLESLTLAIGWVLVVIVCSRGLFVPIGVALISAGVLTQLDLKYFLDRLDFSSDTTSLSTLVYIQGWDLVDEAMRSTRGWGLGFQQLGLQGTNTEISRVIYLLLGSDANITDGGFGLAKLVGEFGFVGIVLAAGVIFLGGQSLIRLRTTARRPQEVWRPMIFASAVLASYLVEFLVRGVGYFSPSAILLVAAVWMHRYAGRVPALAP